jgi:fucose permease
MWVAQGKYVSDSATEKSKGFYFGYFWAYYMASQVAGNLIAALVLSELSQLNFIIIMSVISFTSCLLFFFLKKTD